MAIESFIAKLGFDLSAFRRGIDSAKKHSARFAKDIAKDTGNAVSSSLGKFIGPTVAVGAVVAGTKAVVDYADAIAELSADLGTSTDFLQGFTTNVARNGGTIEQANKSLLFFSRLTGEAASGSEEAQLKLGKFGVTLLDSNGTFKTTDELVLEMVDSISKLPTAAERAAAAFEAFGKSSPGMLGVIEQGRKVNEEFIRSVDKLSEYDIRNLAKAKSRAESFGGWLKAQGGAMLSRGITVARFLSGESIAEMGTEEANASKQKKLSDESGRIEAGRKILLDLQKRIQGERAKAREKEIEHERKISEAMERNLDAVRRYNEARNALKLTKEDRVKFTLEELANSRVQYSGRLGAEQAMARQAQQLEQWAERNRTMGYGDLAFQQLNRAGQIREGITNLTQSERFPFQSLTDRVDASNAELRKLNSMAATEGLLIRPTNGA